MKKTFICTLLFTAVSVLFSCSSKSEYTFTPSEMVTLYDAGDDSSELSLPTQTWHKSNQTAVVVFGYGYNDEEFVNSMEEKLYADYGNYHDNGHLLCLVYPDDFKHGSKAYISDLANILSDKEPSSIVILGAPEGTYKAIARLQDSYNGILPCPVISLFSQDEVVPMEDSADFVVDKAQKTEIDGMVAAESTADFVKEVPEYLERSLKLADISESPFAKDAKLFDIVKMITGSAKISRYSDPDTGLISINHFVLE